MRKKSLFSIIVTIFCLVAAAAADTSSTARSDGSRIDISNPYKGVDWTRTQRHKAAMHLHTLQSDGFYSVDEVIRAYRRAGFTIISITDHDWNEPNRRIVGNWGPLPAEKASPYPKDPKPHNFPANPTWPWTDFGAPAPADQGITGIQGNELSYKHHIVSYFNDYGIYHGAPGDKIGHKAPYRITDDTGREILEDDQIAAVKDKGGLAVLAHPSTSNKHAWWQRKSLQWYVERFRTHPPDCLVGIEVTNNSEPGQDRYDEGLWDQLLARFMPARPIWGFGNDDTHDLRKAKQTYNIFFLNKPGESEVRKAMIAGRFCFCESTRRIDYTKQPLEPSEFPELKEIKVDQDAGTISISASNFDEIRWFSAPQSLEPVADYLTSDSPWPPGQLVHVGSTLNVKANPKLRNYVRAEIVLQRGEHVSRVFTNPFGISASR